MPLLLAEPQVFQLALRGLLQVQAWQNRAELRIASVEGSFWQPVRLHGVQGTWRSSAGAITRVHILRTEAEFAWRDLVSRPRGHWFRRLTLDGVTAKVELPTEIAPMQDSRQAAKTKQGVLWWPAPARVEARAVDFLVTRDRDWVHFENSHWSVSELEPGVVRAAQITVRQPWLTRTFRNVHGATAMRGGNGASGGALLQIADLALEPGVQMRSFSVGLDQLARGQLLIDADVAAFGGSIRALTRTLPDEAPGALEAVLRFSHVGVAPMATFLGLSDATGGTIRSADFNFRGVPRDASRATSSLRLTATDFQWESRQWNSLVLGASLMNRRLQIPELELRQGENQLSLKEGEYVLPAAGIPWWQSDFNFNLSTRIENLTELSALVLPEFKYAAGRVSIDGAVRRRDGQFFGALIASGSGITWRNAPIEEMHAAIRLNGNEFQIANMELLNGDDYLRGRGVMNIVGAKQYWGELRGAVRDLATYAALLQKPFIPTPLAGGATINWTGEGSAKGHSGKFSARLQKLRTLAARAADRRHALNADLEGTYAPGAVQFSRFVVSDDESAFTATVALEGKAVRVQDIRLAHGDATWLRGDAILPLDIRKAWPDASLSGMLAEDTPVRVELTASNLRLGEFARLTGWKWPVEGTVNGRITGEGVIGALRAEGKLTVEGGRFPLGGGGDELTEADAVIAFSGQTATLETGKATHRSGRFGLHGGIDLRDLRNPLLKLVFEAERFSATLLRGMLLPPRVPHSLGGMAGGMHDGLPVTVGLRASIDGPFSGAHVQGEALLLAAEFPFPEAEVLWKGGALPELPPLFQVKEAPWRGWTLALAVHTPEPIECAMGQLTTKGLKITGSLATPEPGGELHIRSVDTANVRRFPVRQSLLAIDGSAYYPPAGPDMELWIDAAELHFREGLPGNPTLDVRSSGIFHGEPFRAFAVGPITNLIRWVECFPQTREDAVIRLLRGGSAEAGPAHWPGDASLSLRGPREPTAEAEVHAWQPISAEPAGASMAAPATVTTAPPQ